MKTQRKMFMVLIFYAVMVLLMAAAVIPAQAMGVKAPSGDEPVAAGITSGALFTWLLGSGGLILVLSWLCERWAWYQMQTTELKKFYFIVGVALLGSAVHALQLYVPVAVWAQIDPWFQYVSGLVVLGAGAMGLHALTKPE